jgi:hypothetical protein
VSTFSRLSNALLRLFGSGFGDRGALARAGFGDRGALARAGSGAPATGWRAGLAAACAVLASVCSLLAVGVAPASADSCPNAQLRYGYGAYLPDCRAYEQVTPVDKDNSDIWPGTNAAATDGNAVMYASPGSFAGNPSGSYISFYRSVRGPSGWTTEGISPPQAPSSGFAYSSYNGFSSDLSAMVFTNGDPPLDGATAGTINLYVRDADGIIHLLTIGTPPTPSGGFPATPTFAGASANYSHILFESTDALTPNAPNDGNSKVYDWAGDQLTLVSVLPDGTASDGVGGSGPGYADGNAIASDGSRVFWTPNSGGGTPIYMTEGGETTDISASQRTPANGSDNATYWTASTNGSHAFFTSPEELTNEANTGTDLYEYQTESGVLSDLTPTSGAIVDGVVGASGDGAYVYFVAGGTPLASGAPTSGDNLYVSHSGVTTFIATLGSADIPDWQVSEPPGAQSSVAQVSADGAHLLFTSHASLTGYDNGGHSEIYLYDTNQNQLICVSCDPTGAPAASDAALTGVANLETGVIDQYSFNTSDFALYNNISLDGGRVFFETADALVPQDTNGQYDVYEWERAGVGSCESELDASGCVYLISSGRSREISDFLNATPSGDDVFFLTRQQLVSQDVDDDVDVYDARVDGGFPAPAPEPPPCSGDSCRGEPATAPAAPVAASITFFGPGNSLSGAPPAKARVLTRTVHGTSFILRIRVPGAGRILISGADINRVERSFAKAGAYQLRVTLTTGAKRALARKRRLKFKLHVRYTPPSGPSSSALVQVTVDSRRRG